MKPLSYVALDASALVRNLQILKKDAPVYAVVKGNAYGHGCAEIVRAIEPYVDGFQVDDLEELRVVRSLTRKSIMVLGYVAREALEEAVALRGEMALYDAERLPLLNELQAKVHLKIDALLGRQGVLPGDVPSFINSLAKFPRIEVLAAYGHFANIEDTTDLTHAYAQVEAFNEAFQLVKRQYPQVKRHFSATSGTMTVEPEAGSDLHRVGIGLYGLYPSASLARSHANLGLQPVMKWVSHLAQVKLLPAKHPVGYGLTYVTRRETRIGIVPQGYSDGYDRGLSNIGEVLVHGHRCPVLGRIAMNMFAIDLSEVPTAQAEDEVVLLGQQGTEVITAEEVAAQIGTINYEVTTRVSPLLPRLVE